MQQSDVHALICVKRDVREDVRETNHSVTAPRKENVECGGVKVSEHRLRIAGFFARHGNDAVPFEQPQEQITMHARGT